MVKSTAIFSRLVGIDTLLAFDGVIPSPEDLQLRLTTLIEQLNRALIAENQPEPESESLCRALCSYFDLRLGERALGWQRYSLVHYFYGYSQNEQALSLPAQLEKLLQAEGETIFNYARKLLILLMQSAGTSETLPILLAASHARAFSTLRPTIICEPDAQSRTVADTPRLMVFIIGPFAGKWFNQYDLSASSDNSVVWKLVTHATTLAGRIAHLQEQHRSMKTLLFFPLLADGFENSAILIEQITAWRYALSATRLAERQSCLLALYTRLSQQRDSHDPDRAIWIGQLQVSAAAGANLESKLAAIVSELEANCNGENIYALQRHAMGCALVSWLAGERIMSALQSLFDSTQLDLSGVAFADHGQGFARHGAWSGWLAEKYGILPGLAATPAAPPLPGLRLPPLSAPEIPPSAPEPRLTSPAPRRWPAVAALLVLLLCLAAALYYFQLPGTKGLPPLASIHDRQPKLPALPGTVPLFENGSSNLMPDSEKVLNALLPEIARLPAQQFLIVGHSDNTGTPAVNQALSDERARVIRDWLVIHSGLPASRFIVEGAGHSRPVASNETPQGRAQNRRVEIIPLSTQGK